jgi:hypothetical protein
LLVSLEFFLFPPFDGNSSPKKINALATVCHCSFLFFIFSFFIIFLFPRIFSFF